VDDCDVCGELDGRIEVPGSFLLEGELVVALHVPPLLEPTPLLGHLLITPRRHADTWADLTPAEAPEIGIGCSIARRATARGDRRRADLLSRYRSPFRTFTCAFSRGIPATPQELVFSDVDRWDGSPKGRAEQIAQFVQKLRSVGR
jgi:hypothetical protein